MTKTEKSKNYKKRACFIMIWISLSPPHKLQRRLKAQFAPPWLCYVYFCRATLSKKTFNLHTYMWLQDVNQIVSLKRDHSVSRFPRASGFDWSALVTESFPSLTSRRTRIEKKLAWEGVGIIVRVCRHPCAICSLLTRCRRAGKLELLLSNQNCFSALVPTKLLVSSEKNQNACWTLWCWT